MGIQNAISSGSIPTYASFAALPASAKDGQLAVTLDTSSIYVFDATTSTWVTSSGVSSAENFSYKVIAAATSVTIPLNQQMIVIDSITVDGTLITNGELYLLAVA